MEKDDKIKGLAAFLKEAVDGLGEECATCYRYALDDTLAVFVGWSDGYDADDAGAIHDKKHPAWAINAGIKVRCDAMWCDYEWLDFPVDKDGETIDTGTTIAPDEDYEALARHLLETYDGLR